MRARAVALFRDNEGCEEAADGLEMRQGLKPESI